MVTDSCKNRDLFPFLKAEKEKAVKFFDKQKFSPVSRTGLMNW